MANHGMRPQKFDGMERIRVRFVRIPGEVARESAAIRPYFPFCDAKEAQRPAEPPPLSFSYRRLKAPFMRRFRGI